MSGQCDANDATVLATEAAFFEAKRDELLRSAQGKVVLIKGEEIVGIFDTPEQAYAEGLKRFGNTPFFIKAIEREEPPASIPALYLGLIRAHS